MDPLRKRFFVNGEPVAGSVLHAPYLKPANVLLNAVKQRMQLGNLQQLAQRYVTEDGAVLTAMSRFGQDEIRIDVPHRPPTPAPVPGELVYTPVVREIPGAVRVLIATGPGGHIYTPNRALTGLDLVTDYVTVAPVGGISAGPRSFCLTEPEGWERTPGDVYRGGGGMAFFSRDWQLLTRFPHTDPRYGATAPAAYPWGLTFHRNRHIVNATMHYGFTTVDSQYSIAFDERGVEQSRVLHPDHRRAMGIGGGDRGLYGVMQEDLFPTTGYLHQWETSGEVSTLIATLDAADRFGMGVSANALYVLRIDVEEAGTLRRVVKLSPRTGETLATSADLGFWNAAQYSPVVADDRHVYVIGFESREEEIFYVVKVLDFDLQIIASIDVPPPANPAEPVPFYYPNTFAIGIDRYWRTGVTIDDGTRIAPAGTF